MPQFCWMPWVINWCLRIKYCGLLMSLLDKETEGQGDKETIPLSPGPLVSKSPCLIQIGTSLAPKAPPVPVPPILVSSHPFVFFINKREKLP